MFDYCQQAVELAAEMTAYASRLGNTHSGNLLNKGAETIGALTEKIKALQEENAALMKRNGTKHYDYEGRLKEFMASGLMSDAVPTRKHSNGGHGSYPDAYAFRQNVARLNLPIEATSKTLSNGQRIVLLIRTDM